MRPRIGVTSWHRHDQDKLERWEAIRENYTEAVRLAGGLPLILPLLRGHTDGVEDYLESVDGIVFTGGEDVAPHQYGEPVDPTCEEPDAERDAFELALARGALARRKAVLGICRGLQLLNVAGGGSLYQDLSLRPGTTIPHSAPRGQRQDLVHPIRIVPGTRLARIVGREEVRVTSTHHQIVKDLAPGFRESAHSPDGVIEAIERPEASFVLAVQWHPERMVTRHQEENQLALFRALAEAAGARGSPP